MEKYTIIKVNTGETIKVIDYGMVPSDKVRQCVIKAVQSALGVNMYTQDNISKNLNKIKNEEVEKYYYNGYVLVTVNRDNVDSFYAFRG